MTKSAPSDSAGGRSQQGSRSDQLRPDEPPGCTGCTVYNAQIQAGFCKASPGGYLSILSCAGLDWVGLDWIGMAQDQAWSCRTGMDWCNLGWSGLDWTGVN